MKIDLRNIEYNYLTIPRYTDRIEQIEKNMGFLNLKQFMNTHSEPDYYKPRNRRRKRRYNKSGNLGYRDMLKHAYPETKFDVPKAFLEDDVMLCGHPQTWEIPDDADLLYIGLTRAGVSPAKKVWYTPLDDYEDIVRVWNMLTSHGIVVCSQRGLDTIIKSMEKDLADKRIYDYTLAHEIGKIFAYSLTIPLVYQTSPGNKNFTRPNIFRLCGRSYNPADYGRPWDPSQ